ncbi:MAG: hypothetical protein ACYTFW_09970 [Planctomycetota bacterium]|jgi:hypothetical protein
MKEMDMKSSELLKSSKKQKRMGVMIIDNLSSQGPLLDTNSASECGVMLMNEEFNLFVLQQGFFERIKNGIFSQFGKSNQEFATCRTSLNSAMRD